ncbi:PP2C family protein-serine/threonine phosphatase [Pseudooceanicola aestuarii]|uniref:PP2C family protein-serine/threonine phosphatase n=1 Tax=Pseudooceanicola aestuarii TaxID=2697319 RepID=UPI0013D85841|nr:SpoIIE family protein phosphatase [Pseudooceanicola aestuarii]
MAPLDVVVAGEHPGRRHSLGRLIEGLGYRTLSAADGVEALKLLRHSGAQIVISDCKLPQVDGIGLTRAVRELDLDHYVHIILMTGRDQDDTRSAALAAGADAFLPRERDSAALKARLRAASRFIRHAGDMAGHQRTLRQANERITADLKSAANAQRRLLPARSQRMLDTQVASAFVPSAVVSGDMFGCFALDDRMLAFYAVDVAGQGIRAALLSVAIGHMVTPHYFATAVLKNSDAPDPAALVRRLNTRFRIPDNGESFGMFCGVLDNHSGRLSYCQAAYPSPYYLTPEGAVEPVGYGGYPVGMFPDADFETRVITLRPGGSLVVCSDAAPEAENARKIPFGSTRLQRLIREGRGGVSADLPDRIVGALSQWRGSPALEDDLSILALKWR